MPLTADGGLQQKLEKQLLKWATQYFPETKAKSLVENYLPGASSLYHAHIFIVQPLL